MEGRCHAGADMRKYGHMRVRDALRKEEFPGGMRHAPLVAQFSSMGSITPKWLEEFQHSFSQGSSHEPGQPARESLPATPHTDHGLHSHGPASICSLCMGCKVALKTACNSSIPAQSADDCQDSVGDPIKFVPVEQGIWPCRAIREA